MPAVAVKVGPILQETRRLLSDESSWTRGAWARDARGAECWPEDQGACRWCLLGALRRVAGRGSDGFFACTGALSDELRRRGVAEILPEFNDRRTHAEVLALLDAAAARVKLRRF